MSGASGRILSPVEIEAAVVRAAAAAPAPPRPPYPPSAVGVPPAPPPRSVFVLRRQCAPLVARADGLVPPGILAEGGGISAFPGGLDSAGGGPGY